MAALLWFLMGWIMINIVIDAAQVTGELEGLVVIALLAMMLGITTYALIEEVTEQGIDIWTMIWGFVLILAVASAWLTLPPQLAALTAPAPLGAMFLYAEPLFRMTGYIVLALVVAGSVWASTGKRGRGSKRINKLW